MKKLLKRSAVLLLVFVLAFALTGCGDEPAAPVEDPDIPSDYTVYDDEGVAHSVLSSITAEQIDKYDDTKENKAYRKAVLAAQNKISITEAMWSDVTAQSAEIVADEAAMTAYVAQLEEQTQKVIKAYEELMAITPTEDLKAEHDIIVPGAQKSIEFIKLAQRSLDLRFEMAILDLRNELTEEKEASFVAESDELHDNLYECIGDAAIADMRGSIERVIRNLDKIY